MTILHLLAFVSVLTHTVKPWCRDERSGISTFPVMFPLLQISVRQMRRETIEWWGGESSVSGTFVKIQYFVVLLTFF